MIADVAPVEEHSMKTRRRRIVGVMGSGSRGYPKLARCVGRAAARLGCHLLTGGGGGVMEEASRAFCEVSPREGLCVGILKGTTSAGSDDTGTALVHIPSSPNDWVELPIHTQLPLSGSHGREHASRNHINVLTSDVLVALPGGSGTYSEVTLRMDYGRKVILFLGDGHIHGHTEEHFRSRSQYSDQVLTVRSEDELKSLLSQALGSEGSII